MQNQSPLRNVNSSVSDVWDSRSSGLQKTWAAPLSSFPLYGTNSSSHRLWLAHLHSYCYPWWSSSGNVICNMVVSPLHLQLHPHQWPLPDSLPPCPTILSLNCSHDPFKLLKPVPCRKHLHITKFGCLSLLSTTTSVCSPWILGLAGWPVSPKNLTVSASAALES